MEAGHVSDAWVGYVDWRNRPALRGTHGGMFAASFVLVVEVMENLAFLANASNLVLYLTKFMHMSPRRSANTVTNFMGTAFLLALLGGFLSDAFFTTYQIYLFSATIEFIGLVILTIQAWSPDLKPPACHISKEVAGECGEVSGSKAVMLFIGLYLVALGVGLIKGSLPAHGAEQFDENSVEGRKERSTFFNYYVFCLSAGALIAVTLVVWVEDNKGWQWGFGISTMVILLSIPVFLAGSPKYKTKIPTGSPLTNMLKVLSATILSKSNAQKNDIIARKDSNNTTTKPCHQQHEQEAESKCMTFLNRAAERRPLYRCLQCTVSEVEEVKAVVKILPIFFSTIMLSCCLAQLSTFSVEQAATMDTTLGKLKVPPASLPVFPVVFIMILAPIYDHVIVPFFRRLRKNDMGITHLQRIGIGLVLSIIAMAVAALVEGKRKTVAKNNKMLDSDEPLPITFFWVAIQYLFLGSADLFTLAGLLDFFFTEAPTSMRSLATSLSFTSLAMGYYLSSVLVSIVNDVTGRSGHRKWLAGGHLNHYQLENFYWLMCGLSGVNYVNYLFWAIRYKYRKVRNQSLSSSTHV